MSVNHAHISDLRNPVRDASLLDQCARLIETDQQRQREAYKAMVREADRHPNGWPWTPSELEDIERIFAAVDALYLRELAAVIAMAARDQRFDRLHWGVFEQFRRLHRSKTTGYADDEIAAFIRTQLGEDRADWLHDAGHQDRKYPSSTAHPKRLRLFDVSADIWLAEFHAGDATARTFRYIVAEPIGPRLFTIPGHVLPPAWFDPYQPGCENFVFIQDA
ncbi:MAG TPA: hypothetical protein P5081_03955 [Phycisphaerae bacterium]|nr:hypothetical protein [Phycisphaerae bacterium]HRW52014.1 hypothetical protein [Phycisphaerae bacterium]